MTTADTLTVREDAASLFEQWLCGSKGYTLDSLMDEPPEVVADFVCMVFEHESNPVTRHATVEGLIRRARQGAS